MGWSLGTAGEDRLTPRVAGKKKDNDGKGEARSRADQVRSAVEQAFGATAGGTAPVRERAQELADELAGAASRVREVLEELRPPTVDELTQLRTQLAALERRVAELESGAAKGAPGRPSRSSASGAKGVTAKPAPKKPAPAKRTKPKPGGPSKPASRRAPGGRAGS
jgi:polyhydroxyalkanoate synthesis regulator phasin